MRTKRLISLFICMLLCVTMISSLAIETTVTSHGNLCVEQGMELLHSLLIRQFDAIVSGNEANTDDIFIEGDSTQLYQKFLQWRVAVAVLMNTQYSHYNYELQFAEFSLTNDGFIVEALLDIEYDYANGVAWGDQHGAYISALFVETPYGLRISAIDTDEVMFDDFKNLLLYEDIIQETPYANEEFISIDDFDLLDVQVDEMITDLEEISTQLEFGWEFSELDIEPEPTQVGITPFAASSYTYNVSTGVAYALKYGDYRNTYFYEASNDCTNFVSQCIWAAYGGWSSSDSDTTMATNIANLKRMTNSTNTTDYWFGRSGGGSSPWESVESLWSFVTSNPAVGPKATGSNNNGVYSSIPAVNIYQGNVLQIRTGSSGKYGHSVYVVKGPAVLSSDYSSIVVAQHSGNYSNRSLGDLIAGWGGSDCYIRKLAFSSANFER